MPANGLPGRQLRDLRRRLHRSQRQGSCLPAVLSAWVSPFAARIVSPALALQRGGFATKLIETRTRPSRGVLVEPVLERVGFELVL